MDENYGSDYISIVDDEGNEYELEHLDTIEFNDELYMAFLPANTDEDNEDFGMIILKVIEEDGQEIFTTVDDDEKLEEIYNQFMEQLFADEED